MTEPFRRLAQRQVVRVLGERPPRVDGFNRGEQSTSFLPCDSPARIFNVDPGNIVGGISALLMQALHPAVAAGFVDHSNYREDPFGRLMRTTSFIREVTFGSTEHASRQISSVRRLHGRVRGTSSAGLTYDADDPSILEWVFLSFVYGFVHGFAAFGPRIPARDVNDAYVRDMGRLGTAFGLSTVPRTLDDLHSRVDTLARAIEPSEDSKQLVVYLTNPPALGGVGRLENQMVLRSACSLLPRSLWVPARQAGAPVGEHRAARAVTKSLLGFVRWSFGPDPNLDDEDLDRFARSG
jgi:uncharacterized protein (DUF2236 family)